jgi:hypothetical protein
MQVQEDRRRFLLNYVQVRDALQCAHSLLPLRMMPATDWHIAIIWYLTRPAVSAIVAGTPSHMTLISKSVPPQKVSPEIMEEFRDHAPAQVSYWPHLS